jgi:hypothetical protein
VERYRNSVQTQQARHLAQRFRKVFWISGKSSQFIFSPGDRAAL